jgi:hypothetical protein
MSTTEMTKPLSPSAQAIEDAYFNADGFGYRNALAAALQAAADQVVPEFAHDDDDIYGETIQDVRHKLLAIAAELENN